MRDVKKTACPVCCPTGGAYFRPHGSTEWRCENCGHTTPRRTIKPTGRVTRSQQRVIDKLRGQGWLVKTEMIGQRVWVTGERDLGNPGQNLLLGTTFYGTVGPRGRVRLDFHRFGDSKTITDDVGIEVYMNDPRKAAGPA